MFLANLDELYMMIYEKIPSAESFIICWNSGRLSFVADCALSTYSLTIVNPFSLQYL